MEPPTAILEDLGPWRYVETHRACRQLQVVREARTKCLPDRCRDGILAAWWAVEVRIKRGQVGPQVEADAGRPHQEPDGALEELAAGFRLAEKEEFRNLFLELADLSFGQLDGVKVEVDIPSTPSDAGLALGFLPANGGVDHLHEDDQQSQAVDG